MTMRFMRTTICAAAAIAAASACAAVTIAERGAPPAYAIVLPDEPSSSEKYAAEELRDHVKKIAGIELDESLSPGEWRELTGEEKRLLYAVTELEE